MTNEEFQKFVLEHLVDLKTGQAILHQGQEELRQDITGLKQGQEELRRDITGLKQGQEELRQDVTGLKQGQEELRQDVTSLKQGQGELRQNIQDLREGQDKLRQDVVRMEAQLVEKIRGLYDFREVQNDVNDRVAAALERIEAKVDVLQMETASIRRIK